MLRAGRANALMRRAQVKIVKRMNVECTKFILGQHQSSITYIV